MSSDTDRVVIGMDPHKRSVTIEVMAGDETIARRRPVRHRPRRLPGDDALRQAVAGPGLGDRGLPGHRPPRRQCGCSADGEQVVDVPPKLSARARVFATGQGRKTDATDAHSVALVGTRMAGLRPVVNDEQLAVLRILVDRRRSLGEDHTRMVVPAAPTAAGADPRRGEEGPVRRPGQGTAGQGPAPRRRRQDPPPGRRRTDQRPRTDLRPQEGSRTRNSPSSSPRPAPRLMDLHGIGPSGAARLLVEVGDITRFPNRDHFASWNGTAPIDASSGDQVRHRLSRAGNRQINRVLHIMATVQLRNPHRRPRLLRPHAKPTARPRWKPCER